MTYKYLNSADLEYKTTFNDKVSAEKELNNKIYPVCPRCHKEYDGYPAISREDNKTEICSQCGQDEALVQFNKYHNLIY